MDKRALADDTTCGNDLANDVQKAFFPDPRRKRAAKLASHCLCMQLAAPYPCAHAEGDVTSKFYSKSTELTKHQARNGLENDDVRADIQMKVWEVWMDDWLRYSIWRARQHHYSAAWAAGTSHRSQQPSHLLSEDVDICVK